jgi:hypothetical protein
MFKLASLTAGAFVALATTAGLAQAQPVSSAPNIHQIREEQQAAAVKAHDARLADQARIAHHREDVRKADLDRFHKKEAERHAYETRHDHAHPNS